jgi:hypothetical protein
MARKQQAILCTSCDAPLRVESAFCPNCGRPTVWATHDERVEFEVRQWRASRATEGARSGLMMLVRTEEGYAPAPDHVTHYTWDQPLHPERENPQSKNPHAAPKHDEKKNRNGNGHAAAPSDAPPATTAPAWVAAAVAQTNAAAGTTENYSSGITGLEGVELAPPVRSPVPAAVVAEEPVAVEEPQAVAPALAYPDALKPEHEVRISKWAVALGIALAVGLPLSGNLIDLSKSAPSGAREPIHAAAAPIGPAPIAVTGSGFGRASSDAARYAVVVRNPNRSLTARSVSVTVSLLDRGGRVVGTAIERIASIAPGARVAVAGQTGIAGTPARLVSSVSTGAFEDGAAPGRFTVRGVRLSRSASGVVVRATVSGPAARDAKVVAVFLDKAGRVVGGDFTYVDVPAAPRSATVVVSSSGVPGVARVEVLVAATR